MNAFRTSLMGLGIAFVAALGASASHARSTSQAPSPGSVMERVGFDQKLGTRIPLNITVVDESGSAGPLSRYFGRRPVLLQFVYFRCPMLCGAEISGLTQALRALGPSAGSGFDVLTISFDPRDTHELAAAKKANVIESYDRPRASEGWHFLTARPGEVARLAESVGFRYRFIESAGEYAHAAGLVVLSPDGVVSRYFFGIDYPPRDLERAIKLAGQRRIGPSVANILMLCYDYDPATGRYTLAITRILRLLGMATLIVLGGYIGLSLWRERCRRSGVSKLEPTDV